MHRKISAKSAFPVFEWKKEKKQSMDQISICFCVLSFKTIEDTKVLLEKTNDIMWAECHAYLMWLFVPDAKTRAWPLTVAGEALEKNTASTGESRTRKDAPGRKS